MTKKRLLIGLGDRGVQWVARLALLTNGTQSFGGNQLWNRARPHDSGSGTGRGQNVAAATRVLRSRTVALLQYVGGA